VAKAAVTKAPPVASIKTLNATLAKAASNANVGKAPPPAVFNKTVQRALFSELIW